MEIFRSEWLALVFRSVIQGSLDYIEVERSQEKMDFIKKNENSFIIFMAFLTLFIINAFSASHLIKLL